MDGMPELESCEPRGGGEERCCISNAQEVLPLSKVALEAQALGDLEA